MKFDTLKSKNRDLHDLLLMKSGAHGWFAFLKSLHSGEHTVYYDVGITGTGPNDHIAEIAYLKVK